VTFRLYERFSPGYGFTAIAVALLGRLDPLGVVVAALFFGVLEAGSNAMQRSAGVSAVLVLVIQATVILFLVALERTRIFLPAAAPAPRGEERPGIAD
jgi:general nucleoside transport system permease protein